MITFPDKMTAFPNARLTPVCRSGAPSTSFERRRFEDIGAAASSVLAAASVAGAALAAPSAPAAALFRLFLCLCLCFCRCLDLEAVGGRLLQKQHVVKLGQWRRRPRLVTICEDPPKE